MIIETVQDLIDELTRHDPKDRVRIMWRHEGGPNSLGPWWESCAVKNVINDHHESKVRIEVEQ